MPPRTSCLFLSPVRAPRVLCARHTPAISSKTGRRTSFASDRLRRSGMCFSSLAGARASSAQTSYVRRRWRIHHLRAGALPAELLVVPAHSGAMRCEAAGRPLRGALPLLHVPPTTHHQAVRYLWTALRTRRASDRERTLGSDGWMEAEGASERRRWVGNGLPHSM